MQGSISETPEHRIPQSDSLYQPLVGSSYEPPASEDTFSSKPALPPQIQLFNGQVILNPTISRINFVAYLLFSTYLTLIVLPAGLLTLPLLKIIYGLSPKEAINASTISQVVALVVRFIAFPVFGSLCDRFGRRTIIIAGVIFLNAGIILTPGLPSVYPWFILVSLFQDLGLTCVMVPPLLADYIDYETKGRVAGIAGVMTHLASFISTYVTSAISVQDNIPAEYHYIGLAGLVIGVIIILGLKGGAYHKALLVDKKAEEAKQKVVQMIQEEKRRQSEDHGSVLRNGIQDSENIPFASQEQNEELQPTDTQTEVTGGQKPGFKAGIKEAKRNPWILMGYLANFLSLGIAVIINGTLVNYVPAVTGNQDDANQAYNLANKQVLGSLISIFFFGYAMDKLDKFKILLFSIILSMAGVVLMMVAPSPYNFVAYLSMVCFGIGGAGIGTFTSQVLSKYPNPKYRASVSAVGGICSLLGQIWIGLVGMGLSQFDAALPFYLYFGGCVIMIFIIFRLYVKKRDILNKL